nr:ABC transporter ATP-binding protein [Serratia proteamaculans]
MAINWARLKLLAPQDRARLVNTLLWMTACAVSDGIAGLMLLPLIVAWFSADTAQIGSALWGLLAATLVYGCLMFWATLKGYLAGCTVVRVLIGALIQHIPRIPANLLGRIQLPGLVRGPVLTAMAIPAHLLAPLIAAVVTPATVVVGLAFIDLPLAGCLLAAGILLGLWLRWGGRKTLLLEQQLHQTERDSAAQLAEFGQQQALLRTTGLDQQAGQRLVQALNAQYRNVTHLQRRSLPITLAFAGAVQGVFLLVLLLGAWRVAKGELAPSLWIAEMVLLVRFIEPLAAMTQLDQSLRNAWQALVQVLLVLETPALQFTQPGGTPADSHLVARKIGYRLPDGSALLSEIDLDIPPGSQLAIVGPSGAGKSTLLGVLARNTDVTEGQIVLGGVDIRQLSEPTLASWRNVLLQDTPLFQGSIRWNLQLANPALKQHELQQALSAVGLQQEIARLPQGLDSEVGVGGSALSGGQRLRLCLARSLCARTPILLLDEPTASLDSLSVSRVMALLARQRGRTSCIYVTHHPQLAAQADRIAIVVAGQLRRIGSHAQLLAEDNWYREFCAENNQQAAKD